MTRLMLVLASAAVLSACGSSDETSSACDSGAVPAPAIDVSIDGPGYFLFQSDGETLYSRRGDFCVDETGFLINGSGRRALSYPPRGDSTFNTGTLAGIEVPPTNDAGGTFVDASIDADGIVAGHFTLGEDLVLGKLALAGFPAPQNLETLEPDMCRATDAAGPPRRGEAGRGGFGSIGPGLEGTYACDQGRLDVAVAGAGFIRLDDAGTLRYATRIVWGGDAEGHYVDDHGYRVTGYALDDGGAIVPALVDLGPPEFDIPRATTFIHLAANLDAAAAIPPISPFDAGDSGSYDYAIPVDVFDGLGARHVVRLFLAKTAVPDSWDLYVTVDGNLALIGGSPSWALAFSGGALASGSPVVLDPFDPMNGAAALVISLDVGDVTQSPGDPVLGPATQDGNPPGRVTATHVSAAGEITLDFSNGRSGVPHAQLVLARFADPGALDRSGDGDTYLESAASGPALVDLPANAGLGTITATPR